MKKIINDFSTEIFLENSEASTICNLGESEDCCAFLVCGSAGFECVKMNPSYSKLIYKKLEKDLMVAKGIGGWEGCPWEDKNEQSRCGN